MITRLAVIQARLSDNQAENIDKISSYVIEAAKKGAQIVLPSELYEGHYFCKEEKGENFRRAATVSESLSVKTMQALAREYRVFIPTSFFEKAGQSYFNSLAFIACDGTIMGLYRKSHIPDGPGYEEKFYFSPGDTGFKVWNTPVGNIGVGICWDQWFPECARAMTLMGADVLLYPTAIGSEPANPSLDTKDRWQKAMVGHAVSNVIPVAAANRTGTEGNQHFYGHSFFSDSAGQIVAELKDEEEGVLTADFDFNAYREERASWGFFRDRRRDLYTGLTQSF
jgi:N-carbamoylputrescine amidase